MEGSVTPLFVNRNQSTQNLGERRYRTIFYSRTHTVIFIDAWYINLHSRCLLSCHVTMCAVDIFLQVRS